MDTINFMKLLKIKNLNSGVALLFSILITGVLFVIALGTTEIAVNQSNFNTSTRKSNEAFFAADTGSECALFFDKDPLNFPLLGPSKLTEISCGGNASFPLIAETDGSTYNDFKFVIPNIDGTNSCAKILIQKRDGGIDPITLKPTVNTRIISKGYDYGDNKCFSSSPSLTERQLELNY